MTPKWLANRVISPVTDLISALGASLKRPQLDLGMRIVEWGGALHDPTRHYLLLRNAWDTNPGLLARVYTQDFLSRLRTKTRELFDPYFEDARCIEFQSLRAEFNTKMVNDLLHNEDTMSMAHSVESRVPLLDIEFVRAMAQIPDDLRFRYGMKGLFKKALQGIVPPETLTKKKWGFSVDPVEQFRKDLRTTALEFLEPRRLREQGIFNPRFVEQLTNSHPTQRLRWHYFMLWQMIGFSMWSDRFLSPAKFQTSEAKVS